MSNDYWEQWAEKATAPVPPGVYAAKLKEATLAYDANGLARTNCTFVVCEGQPSAGRYLWVDWPHDSARFGWLARQVYSALMGPQARPQGDTAEAALLTMAREISDCVGRTVRLTTHLRTYKNQAGQEVQKARVGKIEAIVNAVPQQPQQPQQVAQQPQQQQPTQQGQYGGKEPAPW